MPEITEKLTPEQLAEIRALNRIQEAGIHTIRALLAHIKAVRAGT